MRSFRKITALMMLAVMLAGAAACTGKSGMGASLGANIARVYTPADRTSRFMLNGAMLEGTVTGKAYFDASADGRTALAWVDTVLYFVSEKGVDSLGADIGTAEISCDGKSALFVREDKLYRYSLETRSSEVIDEGISMLVQFAFSPSGESVMYTANYADAPTEYRTKLYKNGSVSPALANRNAVVIAVSDNAGTVWYYDITAHALCADVNGERTEVSRECGASTNYNFTNDLGEVIFSTTENREIFYRLKDGLTADLGEGFGYSLKTDVYSISKVSLFSYVNDVGSFLNGFFMLRKKGSESYIYSLGYLDGRGKAKLFTEQAYKYLLSEDGSRILWLGIDGLYAAGKDGKAKKLAERTVDIIDGGDGRTVWYQTDDLSLWMMKDGGAPREIDTDAERAAVFGGACWYIKDYKNGAGTLMKSDGGAPEEMLANAARIDRRAGQLLIYADPMSDGTRTLYTLYVCADAGLVKVAEGVEP